jgi:putative PEGA domain protein
MEAENMGKKILSVFVALVFFVTQAGFALAATPEAVQDKLGAVEKDTYGTVQTGALMDRLNKLERDYDGSHRTGSMSARINAIYEEVYTNSSTPSILANLNAIEWYVSHEVSMDSVEDRIVNLEQLLKGKTSTGTYRKRIDALQKAAFGADKVPLSLVTVPANTLIKAKLVTPVNTKNIEVGDRVAFQVAQDVMVDGNLVFAKGLSGEGRVAKVKHAKNFGRNAELEVDFEKTKAIDGRYVDTFVGDEAKKEMKQLAMAAGASLAGMVILGPVGIIAGAFVKGKDIDLPAGTEFYLQTKADTPLYGVVSTQAE